MAATDHGAQALRALERADHVRNADRYHGDRGEDAIYQVGVAHVHALLALGERLEEIAATISDVYAAVSGMPGGK